MDNREFAESDKLFRKACELANITPSARQAGKWHNGWGEALRFREAAAQILETEKKGCVDKDSATA